MAQRDSSRRILLVSYHFGRDGATGGFRWAGLVPQLEARGWAFDVVTGPRPEGPHEREDPRARIFPVRSRSRLAVAIGSLEALPGAVRRLRASRNGSAPPLGAGSSAPLDPAELPVWSPEQRLTPRERVQAEISALRELADVGRWVAEATRLARALARERGYRCVIVSSPPHDTQMVGVRLARKGMLPHVADLRDPWVLGMGDVALYLPAVARRSSLRREWTMISHADVLVHNTERHRDAVARSMEEAGLAAAERPRQEVVRNGSDGDPPPGVPDPDVFRVTFTGWLHPFMDVRALFRGVGDLVRRQGLAPERCRLELVGTGETFAGVPLRRIAAAYGLERYLDLVPRVPRQEALAIQARASVLVAFDCLHTMCVPMKVFDYALMRGRLLLIGNRDGAMADAAAELGVEVCAVDDPDAVDRVLNDALARWRSPNATRVNDPEGWFSRARQVDSLEQVLEGLSRAGFPDRSPGRRAPVPRG